MKFIVKVLPADRPGDNKKVLSFMPVDMLIKTWNTLFMKGTIICFLSLALISCGGPVQKDQASNHPEFITRPSGLQYQIWKEGEGRGVKEGDTVLIYETVKYRDSTLLYSNENSSNPVKVQIGAHQATEGEDEGIRGMKPGEIRILIIPPSLSKRTEYPANLSPDSTIVVKVILDKIL